MNIYPKPRTIYFAGYRIIPTKPFVFLADEFIENGKVNEEKLEQSFPRMHELNTLVSFLKRNNLITKDISDIVEIEPYY